MKTRDDRGFTLIEVLVSIILAAILAVGVGLGVARLVEGHLFVKTNAAALQKGQMAATRIALELKNTVAILPASNANGVVFNSFKDKVEKTRIIRLNGGNVDPTRVVVESTGVVHAGAWMEAKRRITFGGTTGISRTSPTPSQDTEEFVAFVEDNNVFVYGSGLVLNGNIVYGPGATVVIRGPLTTNQLNGGASVGATTIYVDGYVELNGGSASLGSSLPVYLPAMLWSREVQAEAAISPVSRE